MTKINRHYSVTATLFTDHWSIETKFYNVFGRDPVDNEKENIIHDETITMIKGSSFGGEKHNDFHTEFMNKMKELNVSGNKVFVEFVYHNSCRHLFREKKIQNRSKQND